METSITIKGIDLESKQGFEAFTKKHKKLSGGAFDLMVEMVLSPKGEAELLAENQRLHKLNKQLTLQVEELENRTPEIKEIEILKTVERPLAEGEYVVSLNAETAQRFKQVLPDMAKTWKVTGDDQEGKLLAKMLIYSMKNNYYSKSKIDGKDWKLNF